jgi:hypothetical protein
MSLLQNTMAKSGGDFYNGVATTSLRLAGATTLTNTYGTPTSRKKMSFGGWVKRAIITKYCQIWGATTGGAIDQAYIVFNASDQLFVQIAIHGSGNQYLMLTDRVFRDTSAWYHLWVEIDSTDGTAADRVKVYINGVRETKAATTTIADGSPDVIAFNVSGVLHVFGHPSAAYGGDLYYSDWYFIDGSDVSPVDTVGEFKNGVFIPKDYSPTFGTNGWHLKFDQVGVGTASTSTIGADSSGKDTLRHWTSTADTNVVASDCAMLDSPENNFATYNPLQIAAPSSSFFLSEGNLALTATTNSGYRNCSATFSPMGFKGYIEFVASALNHKIGIIVDTTHPTNQDYGNSGPQHVTLEYNGEVKFPNNGTSHRSASDHNLGTLAAGDVMGMAFDFTGTNRNVWFHRANTYGTASGGLGNPATGANPIVTASNLNSTGPYRFHFGINNGPVLRLNFGQDGTFGGTETAQGNTDANGNGDFYYAVPAGFLALCTANMSEPTIGANSATQADDYFNTVLYTGNGGTLAVDGFGHQPDLLWIKSRNITGNHRWTDSSRGVTNNIISNANDAEKGSSDAEDIDSFDTDGFTVTQASYDDFNDASDTYVAWSWKANGGTATASGSESGNNPAYSVQANPTAGFSIVTYTGTGATGTVPHGLGVVPQMMIFKNRGSVGNWAIYHGSNTAAPATDVIYLNLTNATADTVNMFNDTAPTSSVFTVDTNGNLNEDGVAHVAYIFADVEGYSKFGSYTGNGSADGAFVYTGFRPAWIMMKASSQGSAGYAWFIQDTTRNPTNTNSLNHLFAERNLAENDSSISTATNNVVDVLSNGFKCRQGGNATNGSGVTMIYMAFAESPFKYANAR